MKQITIAGRVGKDAELRHTQDNKPVLGFSVAVDDGYGQAKSTMWFDVSVWGKRGASLQSVITKGMHVSVAGDLTTRENAGKTYLGVNASEITLQGGGQKKPYGDDDDNLSGKGDRGPGGAYGGEMSDDIPFAPEWR